ncbi:MAG: thiopurine S-methyltransferase [Myxococcota bacterium]
MDKGFWHDRWAEGRTAFHNDEVNPLLVRHHEVLAGAGRVLVPLCGKSLDLWWLRDQGHEVIGVEIVEQAVEALFAEKGITPSVSPEGLFTTWRTDRLTVFQGDFFELAGRFDAVWDRAALVALPPPMRARYAQRVRQLVDGPGLLVTYDYPQEERDGPPFAVGDDEVHRHFATARELETLDITEAAKARGWGPSQVLERVYGLELRP